MILWTMKFRARLTDGLSIRKFYQLIQTMAKLSKNACVFRLAPDHFYLMAVGGMAPGGDVWVQGKPRDLFQEYQMEGVTPTENEIYLQLEPDALAKNLVALKNTHSAQSVKLKLTKKRDSPCLSFDLELAPGNVAASGTCRQVTHDFPVVLIPRSQWTEFQEPAIPPFQVSIYLPELKLVKSLVDRYKNMGKRMTMEANNQGKLRFVLESDTLKVITHFAHCARPKFDESLNQSRFQALNDASRRVPPENENANDEDDNDDDDDDQGEDFVSVRVDLKKLSLLLNGEQIGPHRVICNLVEERMLHLFLIHDDVCLQYFVPAIHD
ncbi:checkpoint protein HUS1-like [Tigriopus californicus]|uniref:checkpoint protein HUS1-like n=1 Tax=Tigriopus californicus TaxID=6832 RepID=UPI0027DA8EC8|nr:checkpoint protein HUS1-like [Tigriopus californicus]